MANNPVNAADASVEVFGGWCTEMSPSNLPVGVSPDCPDTAFVPGSASTRPAFKKVFDPPLAPGSAIVYGKSFKAPDGTIYNLYLASSGALYVENLNTPGTATIIFTTFPNSFARSVTAFGREYIALSDGFHGSDAPLQFDGTNVERVTQYGPGAPPTVTSVALPASQMVSSGDTLVRDNNYVTCATATPHGLKVGYQAQISNVPDSNATDVVQTKSSSIVTYDHSVWEFNSGQYRSLFNDPGSSTLADLYITNFGFSIPSSATILGVTISFGINSQGPTTGTVSEVALWKSGVQYGTSKTPATPINTTITRHTYGSAADDWGTGATPADVNSSSFGFAIACDCDTERVFLNLPFTVNVYYTLSGSGTVAIVSSIVINNETFPGQALVTTTTAHGLAPNEYISLVGVEPESVGSISSAQWVSGTTTLTYATNHNLLPGAVIQNTGITTSTSSTSFSFDGTFTVLSVPSPVEVTYYQTPITATDPDVIDGTGGTSTVSWPIPDNTPTPNYFEVLSCPTPTTFYIQVSYSNGTWSTGTVGYIWEGIFYVTTVIDDTHFIYYQPGPDGETTAVGTVTPFGQAAPGIHLVRQSFITDQGYLTKPSPWVKFTANGGQYLQVDDIAVGPSNIKARVIEFTGALGSQFFYIPAPPVAQGILVGTATQIDDNTTTSITLDFSDNTLYAGLCTSIPGNNTPAQITLDGALGFASCDSSLETWGQRNTVTNLLNMDFAGGQQPTATDPYVPTGWTTTAVGGIDYSLVASRVGDAIVVDNPANVGLLGVGFTQPAYRDVDSAPIILPNTQYTFRAWANGTNGDEILTASLSSASTLFATGAIILPINHGSLGAYYEAEFDAKTPDPIPSDLVFSVKGAFPTAGGGIRWSQMSLVYTDTPYIDNIIYESYPDNPEAFDGVTGRYGPGTDPRPVTDFAILNDIPYILTREPGGRLHEISRSRTTLPAGYQVNERAANCGVLSAFTLTKSQADDNSSSGGEEWFAWASESGARIYGGNQAWKISQEIQPNWNQKGAPAQINMTFAFKVWTLNDPVARILYFGLPLGEASNPSAIYTMSYRELDTAEQIAYSAPYRTSFTGRLIATDNTRKWSPWYRFCRGAARMYRADGELTPIFFGIAEQGNVYYLDPAYYTDDDAGEIVSYYTTCAIPTREQEQQLQLSGARKILAYLSADIDAVGSLTITPYVNTLTNPWPIVCTREPGLDPTFDLEWTGGNCEGQRMFFKIQPHPIDPSTDAYYNLQRFIPWFRKSAKQLARGSAH